MQPNIYEMYKYFGYKPEDTEKIQQFYVPYFKNCKKVLDVGCGRGEFLKLLQKSGIKALGIDKDINFCREAKNKEIEIVYADVFEYLPRLKEENLDGIFISHFVEHLPYAEIDKLFELCHQVLSEDGRILVVTPNVSSISLHLDWFYQDMTHVGFRHPKTLEFLLDSKGFLVLESKENPTTLGPFFNDVKTQLLRLQNRLQKLQLLEQRTFSRRLNLPFGSPKSFKNFYQIDENANILKKILLSLRLLFARFFLFPFLDKYFANVQDHFIQIINHISKSLQTLNSSLAAGLNEFDKAVTRIDKSFEVYIYAKKKNFKEGKT